MKKYLHRHQHRQNNKITEGAFQGTSKGYGFVIPDDKNTPDIFIPTHNLKGAIHGDRVLARYKLDSRGARGEICKVLERKNNTIIGILHKRGKYNCVVPDNDKFGEEIFIPVSKLKEGINGQKVMVKLSRGEGRFKEGEIVEILGFPEEAGVELKTIIREFKLSEQFPDKIEQLASHVAQKVLTSEIQHRKDLRVLNIVTIDGEDAKDFDDAVSIEKIDSSHFRLGVHIADVAHYVEENSPIDREAFNRATSTYLVDRVLPMLPFVLSNGICSLKEGEDRLTVSVVMDIDKTGTVNRYEIFESVIKVKKRLTYTKVTKMLEGKEPSYPNIHIMKELAQVLYEKRIKNGSLDFDFPEAKVILGKNGEPLNIIKFTRTTAHRIIEEFMLAANETIAKHLSCLKIPSLYRIHEEPKTDDIKELNQIIHNLNYPVKFGKRYSSFDLQQILKWAKDKQFEYLVNSLLLRSLKLAVYSSGNKGHFGLGKEFYTHFTSPIRRYPDLIVHRILKESIAGIKRVRKLESIAQHSSEQERLADEASEASEKLKKLEYLTGKLGIIFKGVISGVENYGVFVELTDFLIEGLVHIDSLQGKFAYNENEKSFINRKGNIKLGLGSAVNVKIINVNKIKRQIDLNLTDNSLVPSTEARSDRS